MSADLFGPSAVTDQEALEELRRERAVRQRLYPRWVSQKTLSAKTAERQMARLGKAIELLERIVETAV